MGLLLVGIYLIAVGYQGQAGNLLYLLSQEGAFIPWAMAAGLLAWFWRATPPPGRETVHVIIGAAVLGIILLEAAKIIAGVESAWKNLSNFSSNPGNVTLSNLTATAPTSTSSSTPGSPSTSTSGSYSFAQLVGLAQTAGFTGSAANTAAAIALAESGGDPTQINTADPGGSYGLLQINQAAHPGTAQTALDPLGSFQLGYEISNGGQNFAPWTTYKTGAYQQYLPQ
jgi:hypothetical protein